MDIDKLDLQSPDLINENFEKLAALFPNCVTESADRRAIDFDLLKQELSHAVIEGNRERYRLEWPGKREAIVTANLPTTKTLRPVREDSIDFDNTENLYIEGDNLEVLKILQESYFGKIKMIYIDPPYNTGNDFVYRDNFTGDKEEELFESGQIDEYNRRLVANPEASGRYHSDWLSMMYPRLKLARNLLTEDGVIFISIDDNEVHNLRKLCDEVFGEGNFIGDFVWKSRQIVDSRNKTGFSNDHEFILVYCNNLKESALQGKSIDVSKYSNPDNDSRGLWMSNTMLGLANAAQRPNLHYPIIDPKTGIEYPCNPDTGWRFSKETMAQKISEGRILFPKDPNGRPREKKFLNELETSTTGVSSVLSESVGYTLHGTKEVRNLFDDKYFDFPKPVELIKFFLGQGTSSNENYVILDFFSGSATTAHAVMQLNSEDGGNRKYIMVQLPEQTDENSEAYKAEYKNICEIGKERIRRAGRKIKENSEKKILGLDLRTNSIGWAITDGNKKIKPIGAKVLFEEEKTETLDSVMDNICNEIKGKNNPLDIGFRVYRLDSSNMQDVYYRPQDYKQETLDMFADNIKPDRSSDDLLAQVMLDWGLPLSYKIEQVTINGKQVFKVAQDSLFACFDKGIDEAFAKEIAKEKPLRVVFRDNGFANDTAKTNVQQLLKQLSPETEMKVI
jgi:adenine-specific DNA-methyltransferase